MKKLHVNLDDEAEAAWNSVLLHPNFRRVSQQGVIETLCLTYLRQNVAAGEGNKSDSGDDGDHEVDPATIPGTPEYNAALDALLG